MKCDACGRDLGDGIFTGGVATGATILCKKCAHKVQAEIDKLCAAGEKASAIKIAARMRKGTLHQYILRDIPPDTWEQVQAEAARRGISAKEFIFGAIKDALKHP